MSMENDTDGVAEVIADCIDADSFGWKVGHFDGLSEVWIKDQNGKHFRFIVEEMPDDIDLSDAPWEID